MTRAQLEWSLHKRTRYYYRPWHPDRGANDEGYHWKHCTSCGGSREHELNECLSCDERSRR
jgi:hypothetical protein